MSFLMRLLQTAGLSLALMTATAAGVRAAGADASDTEIGADGANALGYPFYVPAGPGGPAAANAAASSATGHATATATATGGSGGIGFGDPHDVPAGPGGPATANATASSLTGSATATATATGGNGGIAIGENNDVPGGDATATSTATTNGSGNATSTANATGGSFGAGGAGDGFQGGGGNADALADALATGGGGAFATAVATSGESDTDIKSVPAANASSSAETANGATAEALSTVNSPLEMAGTGTATAKTRFGGVSVQSDATTSTNSPFLDSGTVEAVAQGGSGQTSSDLVGSGAISTALPDKAYATTLIGDASAVAAAFLGPGDEIFGSSILEFGSSTFDFHYQGDLLLGIIGDGRALLVSGFSIGNPPDDTVINLGHVDTNIDLTIFGEGTFVIGGAVPEPSTWALMLPGFAGLGYLGYSRARGARGA